MTARTSLSRLATRLTWRSSLVWSLGFATLAAATVAGYAAAYPSMLQRRQLATQIGSNLGFQALYGAARRLDTLGGFAAWRVGGLMVVIAALWGALSTTKLLRGHEETGRIELVLAGAIERSGWFRAVVGVTARWQIVAGVTMWIAFIATGLSAGGAALIAIGVATAGLLGVGLGALTSQIVATRRGAAVWAGSVIGLWYLLRVLADGTSSLGVLRWSTPFGWIEEIRPFAGSRVWPIALAVAVIAALLIVSGLALGRRDHGGSVFADHDTGPAGSTWLRGPGRLAARLAARPIVSWALGMGIASAIMGLLAIDVANFARRSPSYVKIAKQLGIGDPSGPGAFLGLAFGFLVVPLAVHVATQASATRDEEASGRLDQLLVQPIGRGRWLLGRCLTTLAGVTVVALAMAAAAWGGVVARGGRLALVDAVEGTLNLVPLMVLVAGVGVLVHGIAPRATAPATIGFVAGAYALQLIGALVRAPQWVLDLSPFHHLAAVPAVDVAATPLVVFVVIGSIAATVGLWAFDRRDIVPA